MQDRYVALARWLHWLTALLVLALMAVGAWIFLVDTPDPLGHRLYNVHESAGVLVFVLVLWRLLVRWRNPPPPLPACMPVPMRLAAHATHWLLYALLLVQSLVGFIANAAGGFNLVWFEVLPIPSFVAPDKALSALMFTLHLVGGVALALLIGAHIVAALYHHFIRRDGLLRRMW